MPKTGIHETRLEPIVNLGGYVEPRAEFFRDGREGVDRWGRERATLWACGTGWDDYVCPAYVEESCPGDRGKGLRTQGDRVIRCDLKCGQCGGGGRSDTMAYCGWQRGEGPFRAAMKEMGGSLRLDRYTAAPAAAIEPWGIPFMPQVEWGVKDWMSNLTERYGGAYPWVATTYRTGSPGQTKDGQPLRERLGGFEGKIVVHGLVKDDVLDDAWDNRRRLFKWLVRQDPDLVVTPQFSYYSEDQNCMAVYNSNRIFAWYCDCVEAGFRNVALDYPPYSLDWLRDEYMGFIERAQVKTICISYQTMGSRGGMDPFYIHELRRLHRELPADVSFLLVGITQITAFVQAAMSLPGRNLAFTTADAFARAAFFRIVGGDLAPKRYSKGDTFAHNVMHYRKLTAKALAAGAKKAERQSSTS